MRTLSFWIAAAIAAAIPVSTHAAPTDSLTLSDAIARVEQSSAGLRALRLREEAARHSVNQARRRINPVLTFDAENIGGDYNAFDQSELTLGFTQTIELGGKRGARSTASQAVAEAAALRIATGGIALRAETARRFNQAAFSENELELARANLRISEELTNAAKRRVESGAALLADRHLSLVAHADAELAVRVADQHREGSRRALSALWGDADGFDERIAFRFTPAPVPPLDSLLARIPESPAVRTASADVATERAAAGATQSLRGLDIDISGGVRRVEADDATTFLVGVAVPLPIWDRRQGSIAASQVRISASEAVVDSVRIATEAALRNLVAEHARVDYERNFIATRMLPEQSQALATLRDAYLLGRASYSDLLEVQRDLLHLRMREAAMQREARDIAIAIDELLGMEEIRHED